MEFIKSIQADIMVLLSGICGIIALFVYLTETMSKPRKKALMLLEISAMFLMIAEHLGLVDGKDQQFPGVFPDACYDLRAEHVPDRSVYQ